MNWDVRKPQTSEAPIGAEMWGGDLVVDSSVVAPAAVDPVRMFVVLGSELEDTGCLDNCDRFALSRRQNMDETS
jgi:hypothetical protein